MRKSLDRVVLGREDIHQGLVWGPMICSYASLFIMGMLDNVRGPTYPEVVHFFGVNQSMGSLFFASSSGLQMLTTLAGRWWLPALGSLRAWRIFLIIQGGSFLAMALSAQFAGAGWWILLFGASLFGVSLGGNAITQSTLVAESLPVVHQRRAFAGLHSMYGIASLLAPAAAAFAASLGLSWSQAFLACAFMPVALLVASLQVSHTPAKLAGPESARLKRSHLWLCAVISLYVASEVVISSRLVLYTESILHWSKPQAASLLSLFFAGLLAGRLLLSVFTLGGSILEILLVSSVASLFLFIYGIWVNPFGMALCGLTMSLFYPLLMAYVSERHMEVLAPLTTAMMASIGLALLLMHWGVGLLTDSWGLQTALLVGPFCLLAIMVVIAAVFCLERKTRIQ